MRYHLGVRLHIWGGDICEAADLVADGESVGNGKLSTGITNNDDKNAFKYYSNGDFIPTKTSSYSTPQIAFWSKKKLS